jgi:hypothetical protein
MYENLQNFYFASLRSPQKNTKYFMKFDRPTFPTTQHQTLTRLSADSSLQMPLFSKSPRCPSPPISLWRRRSSPPTKAKRYCSTTLSLLPVLIINTASSYCFRRSVVRSSESLQKLLFRKIQPSCLLTMIAPRIHEVRIHKLVFLYIIFVFISNALLS